MRQSKIHPLLPLKWQNISPFFGTRNQNNWTQTKPNAHFLDNKLVIIKSTVAKTHISHVFFNNKDHFS